MRVPFWAAGCVLLLSACAATVPPVWSAKKAGVEIALIGESHLIALTKTIDRAGAESLLERYDALGGEIVAPTGTHNLNPAKLPPPSMKEVLPSGLRSEVLAELRGTQNLIGATFSVDAFDALPPFWAAQYAEGFAFRKFAAEELKHSSWHPAPASVLYEAAARRSLPLLSLDTMQERHQLGTTCSDKDAAMTLVRDGVLRWREPAYRRLRLTEQPRAIYSGEIDTIEGHIGDRAADAYVRLIRRCAVDERNRVWLKRMLQNAEQYPRALYVVGAAHLVGSHGLIALLRSSGFEISRTN